MPKQRYNVMLNPAVLERVDTYAIQNDLSRSDAINRILYQFCEENDVPGFVQAVMEGQIEFPEVAM